MDQPINDQSSAEHLPAQLATETEPVPTSVIDDASRNESGNDGSTYPTKHVVTPSHVSPTSTPVTASPPVSRSTSDNDAERRVPPLNDYSFSRPRFDRLGNLIPERRRPGAMSSVFGSSTIRLPGDLGANDPRRPRSPNPGTLPGDLGPNDPRRPRSATSSPVPHSGRPRHASDPSQPTPSMTQAGDGIRLEEDPPRHDDNSDEADADNDNDSDAEGENDSRSRGRGRLRPEPGLTTSGKSVNVRGDSVDSEADFSKPDPTKGESMLSVRSKVSSIPSRKRVQPSTAFDVALSGTSTPNGSDDESHSELRAAQKLSLTMSAIHSTPSAHRVIRQIFRGDHAHFQQEAEEGRKRQRMYLVATDLSPESQYALEWTIGTVLRDGDTLFAVYAVDEEGVGSEGGVEIGQGARSVMDTAATLRGLTATLPAPPPSPGPSPLSRTAQDLGPGRSRSRGVPGSADLERRRAIEDISQRCVQLLRKTRLQVRVVVEVFHCKSPRHMITEVIDFLSPTLVIIGSRGRSAVKGVLLGSFSNYLVTKSSVPVMVARKKLRKHSKTMRNRDGTAIPYTGTGRAGRFSNVIEAPKTKGLRVQGWDQVGID